MKMITLSFVYIGEDNVNNYYGSGLLKKGDIIEENLNSIQAGELLMDNKNYRLRSQTIWYEDINSLRKNVENLFEEKIKNLNEIEREKLENFLSDKLFETFEEAEKKIDLAIEVIKMKE